MGNEISYVGLVDKFGGKGCVYFSDYESRMYFDKMLRQSGLFDQLERMGIQDGDIVSMYNLEFEYQR